MDELLHHCLRELSFDGDLGCNVSRLRDFIVEFYAHTGTLQSTDDALCAFVWSLVVQQPTVRVGTVPAGVTSEVWIAPQTSAKRKAKAKGEEHVETSPTELDLVLDAKTRTLDDLKRQYGDNLRIAVDPDAIYAAITGSHIRFPKLSPMVYTALQIITRGRDNGITVVGLGQQSKYDQKTCFYLVRQLTELDLVVKVRRGGVGTHFCIHKYFFDRSPSWKAIRDEELRAEDSHQKSQNFNPELPDEEEEDSTDLQSLDFTPIDARHLSSLPLIRGRVVKLLKASRNQMHASNNMLITLGFSNPTKTDRRFFQSRIREMIQQGLIEKVVVPSNRKKSVNASVKCFRLVPKGQSQKADEEGILIEPQDGDEDEKDGGEQSSVKMNITIHKQIIDLLEESGIVGMTLNELSAALCQFDKRTIELLLTRAEKFPPPSHLSDLGIAGLMETSGRERRHRYYTVASYQKLVTKENLDKSSAGYADVDLSNVGGFAPVDPSLFYQDQVQLIRYQDAFKDKEKANSGKARKKLLKNPILPDGSIKQGRPRKYPAGEDPKSKRVAQKRKREEVGSSERTGDALEFEKIRPTKKKRRINAQGEMQDGNVPIGETDEVQTSVSTPKEHDLPDSKLKKIKKNNRPLNEQPASELASSQQTPKRRGRPPKKKPDANMDPEPQSVPTRKRARTSGVNEVEEKTGTVRKRGRLREDATTLNDVEITATQEEPTTTDPISLDSPLTENLSDRRLGRSQSLSSQPKVSRSKEAVDSPLTMPVNELAEQDIGGSNHSSFTSPMTILPPQNLPGPSTVPNHPLIPIDPILLDDTHQLLHGPLEPMIQESIPTSLSIPATPVVSPGSNLTPLPEVLEMSTRSSATTSDAGAGRKKRSQDARVNVSHLRRENEIYRVIENMGGIVNIQTKEFYEEHIALLHSMAQAGEATSAPAGTRTDKRTAVATINNMETRGRVKQLKTAIMTHTGVRRSACIVYLPTISQEKLNTFLADLARGVQPPPVQQGNFVKIDERVEYGANPASLARGALPLQLLQLEQPATDKKERWSKNIARAEQLFSYDNAVIREVLLTERTTLGQMYGFIVGKLVRARELHVSTLDAFEKRDPSPNIISHQHRIVDLFYFCHDITLGLYCSLVSSLSHDEDLTRFLATEEGRKTPVRDLPANLNHLLQVGRSRARSRFLDILEILRALKLVTPLQVSTSDTPFISFTPHGDGPSSFDVAPLDGWTINTPMAAPVFWHFNDVAPVHIWAASETTPPFWQDVPVALCADSSVYWNLLQQACTDTGIIPSDSESVTGPSGVSVSMARSLRRTVSWNPDYILTWHQTQYLKQFIQVSTARTPLDDDDGGSAQIEKISWVISAPPKSIRTFYQNAHDKILRELEKARRKSEQSANKRTRRVAATKASLAKKAADARIQRETDWELMINRLHPSPLEGAAAVRIQRVRARFLQSGLAKDAAKWEAEITEALREADIAAKKVLKVMNKRNFARSAPIPLAAPPAPVANPPEKSIQTLIAQQGPPIVHKQERTKRKRKGKDNEGPESPEVKPRTLRRHRFQWNRDYEELARDASAIIKARCRNLPRLDWAAYEQVFPAVPRNTVRQRMTHIKETPGNETYLNRLEDRWYDLWVQHRGTPLLPDDNPQSPSNFDLIKHIEFLRQHVDKNALRVGFAQPKETPGPTIPATITELFNQYELVETVPMAPTWDFMWNAVVEEGREKRMLRQPFMKMVEEMPYIGEPALEGVSLAESAMKMTLGTPNEHYEPEAASALLHNIGEGYISPATKNLLNRGVLSKLVRDPQKQKPGRQLKISEVNQNALGGSVPRDTFQDAAALEEIQDETWREWPLLATDGDCAALIQLVSENKVEFRVDTSNAQSARATLDWNSKKADDDQIETAIHIRIGNISAIPPSAQSVESSPVIPVIELGNELLFGHGQSIDGRMACCRQLSANGFSDCTACLEHEWTSFNDALNEQERSVAMEVLTIVRQAGKHGVSKGDIRENIGPGVTSERVSSIIRRMTESSVPLLFWAGYSKLVLVSSAYLRDWTVLTSESPATRIFPRRWYDISGRKVIDFWEAALRAVIGVIIFRPGISHAELRWRLRSVYDRQEVADLLRSLQEDGFVKGRCEAWVERDYNGIVGALDEREEKGVFWFIGDEKHWYQVVL